MKVTEEEKQRRKAYYQANKAKLKAYQKSRYEKIKMKNNTA